METPGASSSTSTGSAWRYVLPALGAVVVCAIIVYAVFSRILSAPETSTTPSGGGAPTQVASAGGAPSDVAPGEEEAPRRASWSDIAVTGTSPFGPKGGSPATGTAGEIAELQQAGAETAAPTTPGTPAPGAEAGTPPGGPPPAVATPPSTPQPTETQQPPAAERPSGAPNRAQPPGGAAGGGARAGGPQRRPGAGGGGGERPTPTPPGGGGNSGEIPPASAQPSPPEQPSDGGESSFWKRFRHQGTEDAETPRRAPQRARERLSVVGTIVGSNGAATAIVTDGEHRYYVERGQELKALGRNMRVLAVERGAVTLEDAHETVTLRSIGGAGQ